MSGPDWFPQRGYYAEMFDNDPGVMAVLDDFAKTIYRLRLAKGTADASLPTPSEDKP